MKKRTEGSKRENGVMQERVRESLRVPLPRFSSSYVCAPPIRYISGFPATLPRARPVHLGSSVRACAILTLFLFSTRPSFRRWPSTLRAYKAPSFIHFQAFQRKQKYYIFVKAHYTRRKRRPSAFIILCPFTSLPAPLSIPF